MRVECYESGPAQFCIRGIESDIDEDTQMNLLIEADGDAIVELFDKKTYRRLEIQFCTSQGGTRTPGLALMLRRAAEHLYTSSTQGAASLEITETSSPITIQNIQGNMDEDTCMNLFTEENGNVVVELFDTKTGRKLKIQFNSSQEESHNPGLALKLREVAAHLSCQGKY